MQSCVSQSVFEKVGKLQSVRVQNVPQLQIKYFQGQDIRENQIERLRVLKIYAICHNFVDSHGASVLARDTHRDVQQEKVQQND